MAKIENYRVESEHDPDSRYGADDMPDPGSRRQHPLDSEEAKAKLATFQAWFHVAKEAHAENRLQQQIDYDYYDHIQWSEEDIAVLRERNQAPLVYNKIAQVVNWAVGTERRNRVDYQIVPRREAEKDIAAGKSKLMKYLQDTSGGQHERSKAFKDLLVVGVGWVEEGARSDRTDEPVFVRYESWRNIWWDPQSRRSDLEDCRFIFRIKWVDLDVAIAMFPDRKRELKSAAAPLTFADSRYLEDDDHIPMLYRQLDPWGRPITRTTYHGDAQASQRARKMVRLVECWYSQPEGVKRIWSEGDEFYDVEYDESNPAMVRAVKDGHATVTDAVVLKIRVATFIDGTLLQDRHSPYRHQRMPFTPYWAYRRDRDGMPYGMTRGARDAQEDFNKRMSKTLHAASTNQVIAEEGAVHPERWDEVASEVARPDGVIRLADGGLKKFEIRTNEKMIQGAMELAEIDSAHIKESSGVTGENLGQETNAQSGRAVLARQSEGTSVTAELFDNYRFAFEHSGRKQLSLIEQYMVHPKQVRIVGERGEVEFEEFNVPDVDENGEPIYRNDITSSQADFIVTQQTFHASLRMAMFETLSDMVSKLPPEHGIQLLDVVVELMDLPQKDELARRIRKISGQMDADEMDTPEGQQEQQRRLAQQAEESELAKREREAKIAKDSSAARKAEADAEKTRLGTKGEALNVAANLSTAPDLAPAADELAQPRE